jgi:hypothetical protein
VRADAHYHRGRVTGELVERHGDGCDFERELQRYMDQRAYGTCQLRGVGVKANTGGFVLFDSDAETGSSAS